MSKSRSLPSPAELQALSEQKPQTKSASHGSAPLSQVQKENLERLTQAVDEAMEVAATKLEELARSPHTKGLRWCVIGYFTAQSWFPELLAEFNRLISMIEAKNSYRALIFQTDDCRVWDSANNVIGLFDAPRLRPAELGLQGCSDNIGYQEPGKGLVFGRLYSAKEVTNYQARGSGAPHTFAVAIQFRTLEGFGAQPPSEPGQSR